MTPEENIGLSIVSLIVLYFTARWFTNSPVNPDPWDEEEINEQLEDAKPICINCSTVIEDERMNYCPNCNHVTGKYTRYLPYENIEFNYSIFGTLWRNLKGKDVSIIRKFFSLLLILLFSPIMLVGALLNFIISMIGKNIRRKGDPNPGKEQDPARYLQIVMLIIVGIIFALLLLFLIVIVAAKDYLDPFI